MTSSIPSFTIHRQSKSGIPRSGLMFLANRARLGGLMRAFWTFIMFTWIMLDILSVFAFALSMILVPILMLEVGIFQHKMLGLRPWVSLVLIIPELGAGATGVVYLFTNQRTSALIERLLEFFFTLLAIASPIIHYIVLREEVHPGLTKLYRGSLLCDSSTSAEE